MVPRQIFARFERGIGCHCGQCILVAVFAALSVGYVLYGFTTAGWGVMTVVTIALIVVFAAICHFVSKRKICITQEGKK